MLMIKKFDKDYNDKLILFLQECFPQSGRKLELDGRHRMYSNIDAFFENFWCLFDENDIIGTVALKKLDEEKCELKSLYLLQKYQGKGLGFRLLKTAILKAQKKGYKEMYLDTLSTSKKAISLYKQIGFTITKRYKSNNIADVFMVLKLDF